MSLDLGGPVQPFSCLLTKQSGFTTGHMTHKLTGHATTQNKTKKLLNRFAPHFVWESNCSTLLHWQNTFSAQRLPSLASLHARTQGVKHRYGYDDKMMVSQTHKMMACHHAVRVKCNNRYIQWTNANFQQCNKCYSNEKNVNIYRYTDSFGLLCMSHHTATWTEPNFYTLGQK